MRSPSLLIALCCLGVCAAAHGESPVLLTKVEPDWGDLPAGYLSERASVELTVLPSGIPFAMDAAPGSLPDRVVRALAQWRFSETSDTTGHTVFLVLVTVPVRRKLEPDLEQSQRPVWTPAPDLYEAIKLGDSLEAPKAAEMLAVLPNGEALGNFRTSMLVYYVKKGVSDDAVRKNRREIITWLIRTYPQDNILASPHAVINAAGEPLADSDGSAQLKKEWLEAVKQYPKDDAVTAAAASFLRLADPVAALRLVSERQDWNSRSNWLGNIYAHAGLNVTAIAPGSGQAIATGSPKLSNQGLAASFREALLASSDLKLVLSGVATSGVLARELTAHHALPEGYNAYCQTLMTHLRALYPQTSLSCDPQKPEPDEIPSRTLRIGGNASRQNARKKDPKKRAAGEPISDALEFLALIDASGNVDRLELIKGPFALYAAASNALRDWQFSPFVLNNTLVATHTHLLVDVNITR
jgi:hypothetical protein